MAMCQCLSLGLQIRHIGKLYQLTLNAPLMKKNSSKEYGLDIEQLMFRRRKGSAERY